MGKFGTILGTFLTVASAESAVKPAQSPPPATIQCPSPAAKLDLMRKGYRVDGCTITIRPKSSLPKIREKGRCLRCESR